MTDTVINHERDVVFQSTETHITKCYSIMSAPVISSGSMPVSAWFSFSGDRCTSLTVFVKISRVDGTFSSRPEVKTHLLTLSNKDEWPVWLHELYALAHFEVGLPVPDTTLVKPRTAEE